MTGRSTITTVFGAVVAFVGVVLILGSMGPVGEYRDADGYYMSDPFTVDRTSHAVVSTDVDLLRGRWETLTEASIFEFVDEPNDVRMEAAASGSSTLFIGIAPTSAVDEYLGGVAHDEIVDWNADLDDIVDVEYTSNPGTALPGPPGTETFWVASATGTGMQTLDWTIEAGDWTTVIMNADASSGVSAELAFGAAPTSDINSTAVIGLTVGLVALIAGGLLMFFGLRRDRSAAGDEPGEPSPGDTESAQSMTPTATG